MIRTREQRRAAALAFYRREAKNHRPTVSGPGSTEYATYYLRRFLHQFIPDHKIASLVDVPCGDCYWISLLNLKALGVESYLPGDILPELGRTVKKSLPGFQKFQVIDLVEEVPPAADLILCRDLFQHLTLEEVEACLGNLLASGSRLLGLTSWDAANEEIAFWKNGWGFRRLDLRKPPFSEILPRYTAGTIDGVPAIQKNLFIYKLREE